MRTELTLSLTQHYHVFRIVMRYTPQESIHVEAVDHTGLLLVPCRLMKKPSIGVEEAGEAAYEGRLYLVRTEGGGAYEANVLDTPAMGIDVAS